VLDFVARGRQTAAPGNVADGEASRATGRRHVSEAGLFNGAMNSAVDSLYFEQSEKRVKITG
jgi:hypothetical protein